jgi:hypothetical protein
MAEDKKKKKKSAISKIIGLVTKYQLPCLIIVLVIGISFISSYKIWNWQVLGAIAAWILAAGVGVAVWQAAQNKYYADEQAKVARNSMKAQLAVELFDMLRHSNILETFRKIYDLAQSDVRKLVNSTNEADIVFRHEIEGVLDKFELLGALVSQGIIDERLAIEAYGGPPVLKCWYQLGENYIKKVREKRGLFCKYVEDLAARTFIFQKDISTKDEWICFQRGTRGKKTNLVQHYIDNPRLQPKLQELD